VALRGAVGDAFRLAPARPAIALGLRTALASMVPALLAYNGYPAAIFAVTAGFLAAATDKGGAYRTRAWTLLGLALTSTLALALGSALGERTVGSTLAATLVVLVWGVVFGMAPAYSDEAASVSSSSTTVLLVGMAFPTTNLAALEARVGWMVAGFAWAAVLTLGLWTVRVYKPARRAVATAFESLADYTGRLIAAEPHQAGSRPSSWGDDLQAEHRTLRDTIEVARRVLAATRRGRRGEAGRGARLLALVEVVERAFPLLIAITDLAGAGDPSLPSGEQLRRDLAKVQTRLRQVASVIRTEGRTAPELARASLVPPANEEQLSSLLSQLARLVEIAMRIAVSLYDDRPIQELDLPPGGLTSVEGEAVGTPPRRGLFEPIQQNLSTRSLIFRHATRLGITLAVAVALVHAFDVRRGYWVTLTVALLLQPHAPAAFTKILQRVGGTVCGGILASLVATYVHARLLKLAIVTAFAATSTAVLQINYGLFSMFLTPTFVLLAEMGVEDPTLARVRITNTILGAALALASTLLLWPSWERDRLPDTLAAAIEALATYVRQIGAVPSGPEILGQVIPARRALGLALNNAEASLTRHLNELSSSPQKAAGWMTLVTYSRRMGSALSAWASLRTLPHPPLSREQAAELSTRLGDELTEIAASLRARRPLQVPEVHSPPASSSPARARPGLDPSSERLTQMAFALAHAASRALGPSAPASIPAPAEGSATAQL
jgi:uncharacterized membrane protein YccC